MKKLISFLLTIVMVFSLSAFCFAAESVPPTAGELEWKEMMDLAEETFPELKADMQQSMESLLSKTPVMVGNKAAALGRTVFHEVRVTSDGGILGATKFESGVYGFVYSADWMSYTSDGLSRKASLQAWYMHVTSVVKVFSLEFRFNPGGNDFFQNTGYAVTGPYSQEWPVATQAWEGSNGPAYSMFEVQWDSSIGGIPVYETMGIKIEVGGDSVSVYVNGELMLHDV